MYKRVKQEEIMGKKLNPATIVRLKLRNKVLGLKNG